MVSVAVTGALVLHQEAGSNCSHCDDVQVDDFDFLANGFENADFNWGKYVLRISFASSLDYQRWRISASSNDHGKNYVEEIVRNSNISTQPRLFVNKCSVSNISPI